MESTRSIRTRESLIVNAQRQHEYTFILLHGRGDRADSFGAGLLTTYLLDDELTLRTLFPNAKFIFLQAPLSQLAAAPSMRYFQWFDVWNLRPGSEETDLQVSGLRETIELVHQTLRDEIEVVGAENVVLGGLSQGCASSLIAMLLWDGEPFAGCVGMAGWLPFRKLLEDTLQLAGTQTSEASVHLPRECSAVTALAKKLGRSDTFLTSAAFQKIPVFLGHGLEDEVVVTRLGQEAASCMRAMQMKVVYKEYEDLTHWYSSEMLQDVVRFLDDEANWVSDKND